METTVPKNKMPEIQSGIVLHITNIWLTFKSISTNNVLIFKVNATCNNAFQKQCLNHLQPWIDREAFLKYLYFRNSLDN